MEDGAKKTLLKGLTQAFLSTPPEEEPVVEKKETSRKTRNEKRHSPSASEVAASIRKNLSFASKITENKGSDAVKIINEEKQEKQELKVAACSEVVYSAPMVYKINMTENGFMKKIPACKKAEPMKRPADETLIIAAKKTAALKHIQTPSESKKEIKEVKNETKSEVKVSEKEVAKKEIAKKVTTKKEAAKKEVAKKEVAKKVTALKPVVEIQYNNNAYNVAEIEAKAEALWITVSGKKASDLKEVDLYIKPEDNKVYCVFNKSINADFTL